MPLNNAGSTATAVYTLMEELQTIVSAAHDQVAATILTVSMKNHEGKIDADALFAEFRAIRTRLYG